MNSLFANANRSSLAINSTPEQLRFASIPGFTIRADFAGGGLFPDLGPLLLKGRGPPDRSPRARDLRLLLAQYAVGLEVAVVLVGGEAERLLGETQTAEAVGVNTTRGHALGFVNDHAGQEPPLLEEPAQPLD